jgi:hypothetical protein
MPLPLGFCRDAETAVPVTAAHLAEAAKTVVIKPIIVSEFGVGMRGVVGRAVWQPRAIQSDVTVASYESGLRVGETCHDGPSRERGPNG